jgi:Glycosyltransferase family 87
MLDAGLYAASALIAGGVWLFAGIPIQRSWGRIAIGPYAAGAAVALVLAARRRSSVRLRAWLAVLVFIGVALLPTTLEVAWRARTSPGLHAQSEAIVTEEAAKALVHGKDPYAVEYLHGPLAARPLGTKTHFPYLPGMVLFGLPRALFGSSGATDARLAFAVVTLVGVGVALRLARQQLEPERRLRVAQILLVVPTSALLMATGGDDLPVVALMFLAVVLATRGDAVGTGLALGFAAATKQTAWVLVPFLFLALQGTGPAHAWRRASAALGGVVVAVVLPFVIWDAAALVEDVVKFPLGLGRQRSAAETPTLGSWLVRTFPSAGTAITWILVAIVVGVALAVLLRMRDRTDIGPVRAAGAAGWVFLIALVLAPAARVGYLVYPINLLAWSWLFDGVDPARATESHPSPAVGWDR